MGLPYPARVTNWVSGMGLGSFVDINIFVMKYYIIQFLHILLLFESVKLKSTYMLRPRNGNSGVSFNDTHELLFWGLSICVDFDFKRFEKMENI